MSNLILHCESICDVKSEKNHKIPKSRFKNISARIPFFNFNFFSIRFVKFGQKLLGSFIHLTTWSTSPIFSNFQSHSFSTKIDKFYFEKMSARHLKYFQESGIMKYSFNEDYLFDPDPPTGRFKIKDLCFFRTSFIFSKKSQTKYVQKATL